LEKLAMKKSLIALAVLAASGAAMAQSSVTLFGVVDAAVTHINNEGSGNVTGMTSGGNSTSRLGFRGTEDLGGGLAASFWLEGQLGVDDGTAGGLNFTRRSTVSLSGGFGEVRLGRDYTPTFLNVTVFDPFGTRGVGSALNVNAVSANPVRNSNSIGYFLPATLGGFYGQVQYAFGEQNNQLRNQNSGNSLGGRVGFANGPLNVALALQETKEVYGGSNVIPTAQGADLKELNIGASYNLGIAKPMIYYGTSKIDGGTTNPAHNQFNTLLLGVTAPLGAGELRASIARYDLKDSNNDANKFAIGYGYNLSKRTQLYATVARVSNKGNARYSVGYGGGASGVQGITAALPNAGGNSTGLDIGVRHSF
jgi:predicted porin